MDWKDKMQRIFKEQCLMTQHLLIDVAASSLSAIAASKWVGCRRWIGVTGLSVAAAEQMVVGTGAMEGAKVEGGARFSSFLSSSLWYLKDYIAGVIQHWIHSNHKWNVCSLMKNFVGFCSILPPPLKKIKY